MFFGKVFNADNATLCEYTLSASGSNLLFGFSPNGITFKDVPTSSGLTPGQYHPFAVFRENSVLLILTFLLMELQEVLVEILLEYNSTKSSNIRIGSTTSGSGWDGIYQISFRKGVALYTPTLQYQHKN